MNKKNIDRILTIFDRIIYTIVIIVMLISTAVTAWAGNVYNKMRQAVEENSSIYEEVIRVTEETSEIYKELMQLLEYPEKD